MEDLDPTNFPVPLLAIKGSSRWSRETDTSVMRVKVNFTENRPNQRSLKQFLSSRKQKLDLGWAILRHLFFIEKRKSKVT